MLTPKLRRRDALLPLAFLILLLSFSTALSAQKPLLPKEEKGKPITPPVPATSAHELTTADLTAFFDGFVPYAIKNGKVAGVTISVVKDGQILLEKGYGYANVKTMRPMDPNLTLVRVGSTSKLFTWTAVMQLVEQGKLDLDRDINDYLDFKIKSPYPQPITLRNLMTHRAGFQEGLKSILADKPANLISSEQFLKRHQPAILYPPGQVPAYSNYGATLAGYIVQRVSGEPFDTYVEQHIFAPLGMTHSTFRQPVPEPLRADVSEGYMSASGPPSPFEYIITAPAGSLSTTAGDMAKLMIAYLQRGQYQGKQILKPETVHLMWQPAVQKIDDLNVMGLGFFEENRNGRRILGHGGDTIVFHTACDLFVDNGVGIFMSFNSRGANASVYGIRQGLFDAFADRYFPRVNAPAEGTSVAAAPSAGNHAQLIAGRYQSSRRVETAFISVLYLLSQTTITANPDGTINVPTFPSETPKRYRETAPFVWSEVDGQHKVALVGKGLDRTVYTSDDPSSVLQPVRWWNSAPLNLTILCSAVAVLLLGVIAWPLSAFLRWKYRQPTTATDRELLVRKVLRAAAVFDLVYLAGWMYALSPVLNNQLGIYNSHFDPYLRTMQIAGLVVIVAAIAGVWAAAQRVKKRSAALWHILMALSLVGIVWFSVITKLISFNLNY
jgi:CubicO group peptidase (beta-lactamase class C family)